MFNFAGITGTGCVEVDAIPTDALAFGLITDEASSVDAGTFALGAEAGSWNAIILGACEAPTAHATAKPATSETAGFQLREFAFGRFTSRISATRADVWRIRPIAACPRATVR